MPLTLEAALDQIAADHNFTTVSVGRMPVGDRILFTATAHYAGFAADSIGCSSGHGSTIRAALIEASGRWIDRQPPAATLPDALPAFDMADAA